jgi:hypothetical protein
VKPERNLGGKLLGTFFHDAADEADTGPIFEERVSDQRYLGLLR